MGDLTVVPGQAERKKHRSPAYPAISLSQAITRAEQFYAQERRNPAALASAASHWNYGQKSSGLLLTAAALKSFGLMKDIESATPGVGRTVQLTDLALRIILDKRPESPEREGAIKEAALLPKIYADLWRRYNGQLPSDAELKHRLVFDWKFNENSVADFVREFRQTIAYAKLSESDIMSESGLDNGDGDGGDAPEERQQLMHQDESVVAAEVGRSGKSLPPHASPPPPPPPPLDRGLTMRQDVFSLTEGQVTLQWPASLSPESFQDVRDWLEIVKRKISRSVKTDNPPADASSRGEQ